MDEQLRELFKKAFNEGAMYEATLSKAYSFDGFIEENIEQLRLYGVSNRRELLLDFLAEVNGNLTTHSHLQMSTRFVDDYLKSNNCC